MAVHSWRGTILTGFLLLLSGFLSRPAFAADSSAHTADSFALASARSAFASDSSAHTADSFALASARSAFASDSSALASDSSDFAAAAPATASGESAFTAVVTSDLHYTTRKEVSSVIVPGMAYVDEITDAIIHMVIDQKPDVLILTGDNTNGGDREDALTLAGKLQQVKDAGIQVVITTGNHDLNQSDEAAFEEIYYGLPEMADRDDHSLSYVSLVDGVALLAMDDNAVHPGGAGEFSASTIDWLQEMLEKYQDRPILFLSHHNVLFGKDAEGSESYHIQNEGLAQLLEDSRVRLALTGHLHSQMITGENGFYEIVSAMPASGSHMVGILEIRDGRARYETQVLDLEKYASRETAQALAEEERKNTEALRTSFRKTLNASSCSEKEKEKILDLIFRFLDYYSAGSLGEYAEGILQDPSCAKMIDALWDYNYGPWMKAQLDHPPMNACRLELEMK